MTRKVQQLFDLSGKTALVTGGSRGLGLQMAQALGEAGAKIVLSSRKEADLEEATAVLQAGGIDARWIAADCAREEDILRLVDETLQRVGDVDILVNNAGASWGAAAEDHPTAAWDKVMNLNVRGYFLLSREIAKRSMIARRSGRIINIASIAAVSGGRLVRGATAYAAAKAGVVGLTKALAIEVAEDGITVNALAPGAQATPGRDNDTPERREALLDQIPTRLLGEPQHLADTVVFLAGPAAVNITGLILPLDGGHSI